MLVNKKILVTGGSGFIASHLVHRLRKMGAKLYITTKYNSLIDNIRLMNTWENLNIIEIDLRNTDSLNQLKTIKPDIIFHLAAYNHVGDSFLHSSEALNSNAIATANLLNSYNDYDLFVYMSTSETYGKQNKVPFTEEMKPFPISPYAVGKYTGELYALMMHHVYKYPITVLKPFNTFGPFQSARAIIGEIIIKCLNGENILSTEGNQTREFNYVDNIIDGLISTISQKECIGEVINISNGEEIKIKNLIRIIHSQTNSKSRLSIGALKYRPTEIWRMSGDSSKAYNILKWRPKISFEEGLKLTIDWYREYLHIINSKNTNIFNYAFNNKPK